MTADDTLTREEAAALLKVSTRTLDRIIKAGDLPAVKLPSSNLVRIPRSAVEAMLRPPTA